MYDDTKNIPCWMVVKMTEALIDNCSKNLGEDRDQVGGCVHWAYRFKGDDDDDDDDRAYPDDKVWKETTRSWVVIDTP